MVGGFFFVLYSFQYCILMYIPVLHIMDGISLRH